MHSLTQTVQFLHSSAIGLALQSALGAKAIGTNQSLDNTFAPTFSPFDHIAGAINIIMDDSALPADDTTALGVVTAHDPVFLTVDKTSMTADGVDIATVTVKAPKTGAAAVTLICTQPSGTQSTQAVTLANGVGTVQLQTTIKGSYTITVQNPSNRSTDAIIVQAA